MKVVLTHVGGSIPSYVVYCLRQYRIFNPSAETIFIAAQKSLDTVKDLFRALKIQGVPEESLDSAPLISEFRKRSWFKSSDILGTTYPSQSDFWHNTLERLFFIEAFMCQDGCREIFHFENDVMIYCQLDRVQNRLVNLKSFHGIYITPVGDEWIACGLVFIRDVDALTRFCRFVLEEMKKGDENIRREHHLSMVSDMTLLKVFADKSKDVDYFPILPEGEHANHFEDFLSIFDPASWGQYVGGTNNGVGPGWAGSHHYIGKEILDGKYKVIWKQEGRYRTPWVEGLTGKQTRINNLHIHSKQLQNFISEPGLT